MLTTRRRSFCIAPARPARFLHLRIEEAEGVSAAGLGLVHGDIGTPQQLVGTEVLGAEQADADAEGAVMPPLRL